MNISAPTLPSAPEPEWFTRRRERILAGLDLSRGRGIEIGALATPLVRKSEADIRYVDWADRDALAAKYAGDPNVDVAALVDVDCLWGERTLAECFPNDPGFDFVIASHVVEHVPDMIGWLQEISAVLRPGGRLYLAVPDRRYTFDYYRRTSGLAEFIGAYLTRARRPTPAQIFDQGAYFAQLDPASTTKITPDPAAHLNVAKLRQALEVAKAVATQPQYLDVHCWTFTPRSMLETLIALADLGLLPFRCHRFEPTRQLENEMVIVLEKLDGTDAGAAARLSFVAALDRLRSDDPRTAEATDEPSLALALGAPAPPRSENGAAVLHPLDRLRRKLAIRRRIGSLHWRLPRRRTRHVPELRLGPREFPGLDDLGRAISPYRPAFARSGDFIDGSHRAIGPVGDSAAMMRSDIPGLLRVADGLSLYEFAYHAGGDILELGASGALSTSILCRAVRNSRSGVQVVAVDASPARHRETSGILSDRALDHCYRGLVGNAAPILSDLARHGRQIGFAFIDFAQSYEAVKGACDLLTGLMIPGGFMLFHDFDDVRNRTELEHFGIYRAVRDYVQDTEGAAFLGMVGCCAIVRAKH
jgi:SAM-dependent methyltransferase/predicted O-methyltransferase YrrM